MIELRAQMNSNISNTERQQQIVQIVERQQRINIADICQLFNVSEATARRDLETLTEQGRLERVHGGAIPLQNTPPELPILQRGIEEVIAKRRIGQAAAELVQDGETVFLGSGTTVLEVARALRFRKKLTVITNSLPVVNLFAGLDNIEVICLGGMLRPSELSFIGHVTEQALAEFRADKVIIGIHAISLEHGLTNDYLAETMTDRSIIQLGPKVIVVADHTKFGRISTVFVAPVEKIHTIITDNQVDPDYLDLIKSRNVETIIV
jgi:DeoR family transcriptional regulator, aga operon transcriptional repressor